MAKFDLDRARAEDQVQCKNSLGEWQDVHFVGMSITGLPVVQRNRHNPFSAMHADVRMAPKVRTMYVQAYKKSADEIGCTHPHDTPERAAEMLGQHCIKVGEPIAIQITEE